MWEGARPPQTNDNGMEGNSGCGPGKANRTFRAERDGTSMQAPHLRNTVPAVLVFPDLIPERKCPVSGSSGGGVFLFSDAVQDGYCAFFFFWVEVGVGTQGHFDVGVAESSGDLLDVDSGVAEE